jgi:hypothetical protein
MESNFLSMAAPVRFESAPDRMTATPTVQNMALSFTATARATNGRKMPPVESRSTRAVLIWIACSQKRRRLRLLVNITFHSKPKL